MALVPAGYAAWLKSPARYVTARISGATTDYPGLTQDSEIISPIAAQSDAQAEAVRQAQFLAGPLARDTHVVKGQRADLIGRLITINGPAFGYDDGRVCFVIEAREESASNTTTLTVITRLDL